MPETVLLVDDDPLLRRSLAYSLEREGFLVHTAADADEGLALARQIRPDIVLLDIGLPGTDGLPALGVFQRQLGLPVILLTARRQASDETLGLRLGADDYVAKPYSLNVLVARIRSVLRRSARTSHPAVLTVGNLTIDPQERTATVGRQTLNLAPRVFDLLYLLASHAGHVVPLETLLRDVWGAEYEGESQVVYVHVSWLRERLESLPDSSVRIVTVHRVGYKLVVEET